MLLIVPRIMRLDARGDDRAPQVRGQRLEKGHYFRLPAARMALAGPLYGALFWHPGQKYVDRPPCTIRRMGLPHVRQGASARS